MNQRSSRIAHSLFLVSFILLLLAASRILRLYDLEMHIDEVWTIWQTFGTPEQIVRWTPYDWTPLHYLFLGGWKELVGIEPYALRVSSVLIFLIGAAALYRVTRRLRDERTAIMVMLVFGALGYSLRISTEIRAYMLMITLLILAFWTTLRYFTSPTLRRAVPLALTLAAIFYTYLPGVIGFTMLGVYTLAAYRRAVWRWWLPGIIALLIAAPMIIAKIPQMVERVENPLATDPTFIDAMMAYFSHYAVFRYVDYPVMLWVILFVLATALILWRWRPANRTLFALVVWVFVLPVVLFILNPVLKFFQQHYAMALMLGLALWIGWGLSYLRRGAYFAAVALLVGMALYPFHLEYYPGYWRPLLATFKWLQTNMQAGDALVIDPNCCNAAEYEWDYMTKLYFPGGLNIVDNPAGYRRVWYVTDEGNRDPDVAQAVSENRIARNFYGPAYFFFRLYEAPPDIEGILFENGMRFHGVDLLDSSGYHYQKGPLAVRREGEPVRLRFWWSVDRPPEFDYSLVTLITGARQAVVAQFDGPPQTVSLEYPPDVPPQATSQWMPGHYYVEERELPMPDMPNANTFTFRVSMAVYQWWDNVRIPAPGVDGDMLLPLLTFKVVAW